MKLFIKEHLDYIFIYFLNITLLVVISKLDLSLQGQTVTPATLLYMMVVSTVILILFLLYKFLKHKKNYHVIQHNWNHIHESIDPLEDVSPVFKLLNERFKDLYTLHLKMIEETDSNRHQYNMLIHQWVHQMKTPLSVIKLQIQNSEFEEIDERFLISLQEEADKLQRGLELILHSARLEEFDKDLKIERVPIKDITTKVITEHKKLFIQNKVFPEVIIGDSYIESDSKWLSFVIGQILSNAVKYSNKNSSKIIFKLEESNSVTMFSIQDFGIGIQKQDLKRVFEPFFTGINGRTHQESTGMGLYLCKQVCDKLGHTLEIQSKPNEGTTVSIYFKNMTKL